MRERPFLQVSLTGPILQTCFSRSWGGLEIQALEMTSELARRGHDVAIACCPESRLSAEAKTRGLRVFEFPVSGYFHPRVVWSLSRLMKSLRAQIVHCQHSKDLSLAVPASRLAGTSPGIVLSKRVGSYLSKRDLFHRYTYAHVHRVLAVSEVIRRNVIETTPVPAERVLTLHDAIDTDEFSPSKGRGERVREEFGIGKKETVVGFVGRFSPGKGHEELLQAAATLRRERPGVRFLVAGEASAGEEAYEREIRQLCTSLGLDQAVTFAGFRRDVPDVMAAFDILAFPSHAESFGVVLIEAMAMELPVVSTNCDGVLDIVDEGKTGLYVHPRAADELASALRRLVDDAGLRKQLGKAGRARVLQIFDRRAQIARLELIYGDVAGTRTT